MTNPIQDENLETGTLDWMIPDHLRSLNNQIEGYASKTSVNVGETIYFHVSSNAETDYHFEIYRMGWYGGLGGRWFFTSSDIPVEQQTYEYANMDTGLIEYNWPQAGSWAVPSTAVSGVYIAKLIREDNYASYIIFVVRDDARASDVVFQTAVNTYQAYNFYPVHIYGPRDWRSGKSLYPEIGFGPKVPGDTFAPDAIKDRQARKVSFNRPYGMGNISIYLTAGSFFSEEYQMVRWLEKKGYDVRYITDVDMHNSGDAVDAGMAKLLLIAGHSEYWSWEMRDNVEQARDRVTDPINIGFFGANICHWQVRFEDSGSTSVPASAPYRTMVGYKTHYNDGSAYGDPVYYDSASPDNNYLVTGYWRDNKSFGPTPPPPLPSEYKDPEDSLLGVMTDLNHVSGSGKFEFASTCPAWVKTGVMSPERGFCNLIGYEADRVFNESNYSAMRNLEVVGDSTFYYNGVPATSNAVYYEMIANDARVFNAGTIQWSWGLDSWGSMPTNGTQMPNRCGDIHDPRLEVVTENIMSRLLNLI